MFLARVPFGEFEQLPEYWTGDGWSADPHSAAPISERFWAENTMQPRFIGGEWISVVKRDGFFGVDIWIEVAQDPWGPWVAHQVLTHEPRPAAVEKNSYQPIILPWSSPTEGLVISQL